ncbi:cytochrome c [Chromobacterium phragmitis]|uniref:cytochrome c n=1 Tax=Chromobacterium phragmitis TaxID=2202141 RepID=UPI0032630656
MKKMLMASLALAFAAQAFAADPVSQRKEVFKQYKPVVGQMGKVVKGDAPYDKDAFAKLASKLEQLSQQPWQYFPAGSGLGLAIVAAIVERFGGRLALRAEEAGGLCVILTLPARD